ncbi:MAG: ArsR/SmtB family transcription factor [Planctomycetota bacterium]|jgi:DNA-binding transcriptional ArsR family regulator
MSSPVAIQTVDDPAAAVTLLEPTRLKLVSELREPESASGLARRLGLPRQRINYHLRELEKAGLVELVEQRRRGNCTERVVRASARAYLINPAALGELAAEPDRLRDRFSWAYLAAVAARVIRDLATLRGRADRAGKRLATLTVETEVRFTSPAAMHAFAEELANEIARLTAKYHDEHGRQGRRYRFFLGGYPKITKDATPAEEEQQHDDVAEDASDRDAY